MKGAGKPGPPKDSVSKIKFQHSVADRSRQLGVSTPFTYPLHPQQISQQLRPLTWYHLLQAKERSLSRNRTLPSVNFFVCLFVLLFVSFSFFLMNLGQLFTVVLRFETAVATLCFLSSFRGCWNIIFT